MFTHSNAPKCSNLHNNRFDSGGIYDAKGWSLCKGKNRLDHPNNHEQTGCHVHINWYFEDLIIRETWLKQGVPCKPFRVGKRLI